MPPLDTARLADFLRHHLGLTGEIVVHPFTSGFSNLTDLVAVGGQSVVLRRPPPGANVRGGHDMMREFDLLTRLHGHVPVPEPLASEPTGDVLGAPFYVMERVEGTILRADRPRDDRPDPETMGAIADAFVDTLVGLHTLDVEAAGLSDVGRPEGYVQRQVEGWTERYRRAETNALPALDRALDWLNANRPPTSGTALIHNDYKYDNLVLTPDLSGVRAILDWELATVGDPALDLGSTLGYWVEPGDHPALRAVALSPTWWPGNPTRIALADAYRQRSGRTVENLVFAYVYGLVKLAVIAQQIYTRWTLGHTRDARFESLINVVRACGDTAERAIDRDRISDLF